MKGIYRFLLASIPILLAGPAISQTDFQALDNVYGPDPLLFNGIKYTYFLPSGTGGHQYLRSADYFTGSVTIKDETFEGIVLNYDIYNQELLLRYADNKGVFNIIEISRAWLQRFQLGDMRFEYLDAGDGKRFYQVLGNGPFRIFYYWHKDLKLDVLATSTHFAFTEAFRTSYIYKDGEIFPYRNKRGLISVFGGEHKQEIKKYMRKNRIRLKKATDQTMTELINYIGNL